MPLVLTQMLAEFRRGDWLDRRHIVGYGSVVLALELGAFVFFVLGTYGLIVPLKKPITTDFVSFYAAGRLADNGTPELAYDRAEHFAAEEQATQPGISYVHFYYPPTFLLICAALAHLPYLVAFLVFVTATLVAFLWVVCRILGQAGPTVLLPLIAFPAVLWTLGFGQNALLTAALFGAATLLTDRRPVIAGLLFGALCYKPHFGLLIPVALAAGGHWRAFAAAAVSVAAVVLVSVGLFGWHTWHSFFVAAAGAHVTYESGTVEHSAFVNPYGAVLVVGGSLTAAYVTQAIAALAAAALVGFVWYRRLSLPIRAATLVAATILAAPIILFYDLVLAAVAGAWLIRAGRENGFLPWEKSALVGLFVVPSVSRHVAKAWHLPVGSLAVIALLALVVACVRHEMAQRRRAGNAAASRAPLRPAPIARGQEPGLAGGN